MGYLNNDTIIVDAILTKQGRKLLAEGNGLNISAFSVSDDLVNYRDFNPDHVSGSGYYGEAIESLPMLEANPNAAWNMRNPLGTRAPGTVYMTYIEVPPYTTEGIRPRIDDQGLEGMLTLTPELINGTGGKSFNYHFDDIANLKISGATLVGNLALSTITYPRSVGLKEPGTFTGASISIQVGVETVSRMFTLSISAPSSLAPTIDMDVVIDANELKDPFDKISTHTDHSDKSSKFLE